MAALTPRSWRSFLCCALLFAAWGTPLLAEEFAIPRLDAIAVDGQSEDWHDAGFSVAFLTDTAGAVEPAEDFAPAFRLAWDGQGLLFLLEVRDDVLLEAGPQMRIWEGDSVEIYLSPERGTEELFEVVVSPGVAEAQESLRQLCFGFNTARRATPEGLELQQAKTEAGYRLEGRIPWSTIGLSPALGAKAAIQIVVNDSDEPAQRFQAFWFPEERTFENTRRMHTIRLADAPSPAVRSRITGRYDDYARAEISVRAVGELIGQTATAQRGGETRTTPLRDAAGWAEATLHLPLPTAAAEENTVEVVLGKVPAVSLSLPSASEHRARLLMGAPLTFARYVFEGEQFPRCDFENPLLAERLLGTYHIETTFYDNAFNVVESAATPGRYGAVIDIVPTEGRPLRRMQTLYRAPFPVEGVQGWLMQPEFEVAFGNAFGFDAQKIQEQAAPIAEWFGLEFVQDLQSEKEMAILLASLHEGNALGHDAHRAEDPWSQDRQWWVKLKRILYYSDKKLDIPFVCPQHSADDPAPTLREGTESEAGMKPGTVAALDAILQEWVEASGEPFAVALARHATVFLHKAYGERHGEAITVDDPMWMASITKFMSATLMMELVDQGLVGLDDEVGQYLEPLRYVDVDRPLTVRDLYVHTNGLALGYTFPGYFPDHWGDELHDLEEIIAGYYPELQVGKAHGYNGVGYALGGKIMEMVTGEALPLLFKNHLLDPLGMNHTLVSDASAKSFSTPMDIATWGQMMLNRGRYGDYRFLRDETFDAMMPKPLRETVGLDTNMEWGIGVVWMNDNGLSKKTFAHGAASSATFRIDPENDLVIVMTRNTAGPMQEEFHNKFIQAIVANLAAE